MLIYIYLINPNFIPRNSSEIAGEAPSPCVLLLLLFFDSLPAPFSSSLDTFLIGFVVFINVHSCLINMNGSLWLPLGVFSPTLF